MAVLESPYVEAVTTELQHKPVSSKMSLDPSVGALAYVSGVSGTLSSHSLGNLARTFSLSGVRVVQPHQVSGGGRYGPVYPRV